MTNHKLLLASTLAAILGLSMFDAHAKPVPSPLFTDHMVLQRDISVPVWGVADPGEKIQVYFGGQVKETTADNKGMWRTVLDKMPVSTEPRTMTIKSGKTEKTLKNILVGDVWICTGQSNMYSMLRGYAKGFKEIYQGFPGEYKNNNIRLFDIDPIPSEEPLKEAKLTRAFSTWRACDPTSAMDFSATGYFFGRYLQEFAKVPLGLIRICKGATAAEVWTPKEVLEGNVAYQGILDNWAQKKKDLPKLKIAYEEKLEKWKKEKGMEGKDLKDIPGEISKTAPRYPAGGSDDYQSPTCLYNSMIAPMHDFAIKGAIWYQGESNTSSYEQAIQYRSLLPDMIKSWRDRWSVGDFPFIIVQLAPFRQVSDQPTDSTWAWMRESMSLIEKSVPNCYMACIIDAGAQKNIHPPYKEVVGKRLALLARKNVYGESELVAHGPRFLKMRVKDSKAILTFEHIGSGLEQRTVETDMGNVRVSNESLEGFTICGDDKVFKNAQARIIAPNTVEVWAEGLNPVAVRYAWADFPRANLYNKEGLPASPFRTDEFPAPTSTKGK